MTQYNTVLVAVELTAADDQLIRRALRMAGDNRPSLFLVHAIEQISSYSAAYGVAAGADVETGRA